MKVLLEGRLGIGKTTVARRLISILVRAGAPVRGFTTEEMRSEGRRVGFSVEAVGGQREILAHVDRPGPPVVGRYGVDLNAFERVALPTLRAGSEGVLIVDELGKMELGSSAFRDGLRKALDSPWSIVATVHVFRHPFTDALKLRPDVEMIRVTERNRDGLPQELAVLLSVAETR